MYTLPYYAIKKDPCLIVCLAIPGTLSFLFLEIEFLFLFSFFLLYSKIGNTFPVVERKVGRLLDGSTHSIWLPGITVILSQNKYVVDARFLRIHNFFPFLL